MSVAHIDDYRPHVVIQTDDAVHVMPLALIDDWAEGRKDPDPDCMRVIIREWLEWGRHAD